MPTLDPIAVLALALGVLNFLLATRALREIRQMPGYLQSEGKRRR